MTFAIGFLVMMTLLFTGLAQSHSLSGPLAYSVAGACALVAFGLAIARYNGRKKAGE
jgi:hypothetical protein